MKDYPKPPFPEQKQPHPGLERRLVPTPDCGELTYSGNDKMLGRVALITGGDSGIGRAVAIAFAREGADVAISYLPEEEEDALEVQDIVESSGSRCLLLPGDLVQQQYCLNIVEETLEEFGHLDVLVNNAAFSHNRPSILEMPFEEWELTFRINLFAMFHTCKAALPHMGPGSAIINVASVEAFQPDPHALAYSTTKGAIVTFSKALGGEAIKNKIRVNCVCPGPFWTPLGTTSMPAEEVASYGHQTALGRPGQPAEAAPLFVLLASEDGSFIANEVFVVAGGMPLP